MHIFQSHFDDLYTVSYQILDDAKTRHQLLKLYKGSHLSENPYQSVLDFGAYFYQKQEGLFSYILSKVSDTQEHEKALESFSARYSPRLKFDKIFNDLYQSQKRPSESKDDFLRYIASRKHRIGVYRGGSSGFDDEAKAIASAHFRKEQIPSQIDEVLTFTGGFKGAFMALCAVLMCQAKGEQLHLTGGNILASKGYYQSLRLVPPLFGATLSIVDELTEETVAHWLVATNSQKGRIIYAPLVNNMNGKVLTEERARAIARAVLRHNKIHINNPVFVLGDDVYIGSYLQSNLRPRSIGSISGKEIGDDSLGHMHNWTLSIVTPSKTFALPSSRISFSVTGNHDLRMALIHYRTLFSYGRIPQIDELTAAAALALTPDDWVKTWNAQYQKKMIYLRQQIEILNREIGFEAFQIDYPEGGWYLLLRISAKLFGNRLQSSFDAFALLLNYGENKLDSGIAMLPGELFGYRIEAGQKLEEAVLRGTLSISDDELDEFVTRLRDLALLLLDPAKGTKIMNTCHDAARKLADIDEILTNQTY